MEDDGFKPMYLREIQKYVAKLAPLSDQQLEALDNKIYKDFFRMRPTYRGFLAGAIARCSRNLPSGWLEDHCRYVVRLQQLINGLGK